MLHWSCTQHRFATNTFSFLRFLGSELSLRTGWIQMLVIGLRCWNFLQFKSRYKKRVFLTTNSTLLLSCWKLLISASHLMSVSGRVGSSRAGAGAVRWRKHICAEHSHTHTHIVVSTIVIQHFSAFWLDAADGGALVSDLLGEQWRLQSSVIPPTHTTASLEFTASQLPGLH